MSSVWSSIQDELREAAMKALPMASAVAFEIPPDTKLGDIAVPCFVLAKELKQPPHQIAQDIADQLAGHPLVASATVAGPYVNIVLDAAEVAKRTLAAVSEAGEGYGNTPHPSTPPLPSLIRSGSRVARGGGERVKKFSPSTAVEREREGVGERIVLEFISPNANKPLHLGHLRNAFLGEAIARLLEARGHDVHRVCLVNDRGIHIMKSMLAYERWGHGATPESTHTKGDHFVGDWYVAFAKAVKKEREELQLTDEQSTGLEREAGELLRKWEAGDPATRALWERMTNWVLDGLRESYAMMGTSFEREYRESAIWEEGRDIVRGALARGVFAKDEKGNTIALLEDRFKLPNKTVERADGTTVYSTQDIALAVAKERDYHPNRSIIVTGNEQDLYFKQLFAIFEMLGFAWAKSCAHKSYGMVELPEGKMKSREGTVVDADDIIEELTTLAEEEIRRRADAVPGEPDAGTDEPPIIVVPAPHSSASAPSEGGSDAMLARARDIALAAVKFYLLLVTPETTVVFNPKESLAFTGKTGPYLQYMYARICSIQRKSQAPGVSDQRSVPDFSMLTHPTEKQLLLQIARFPDVVTAAADTLDPSTLAQFLYDFAKAFAGFYHDVPVNSAEGELREARHALLDATKTVLARGLTILGITPLSEM